MASSGKLFGRVSALFVAYPYTSSFVTRFLSTSGSDALVQTQVERKEKMDWERNLKFAVWGAVQTGWIQHWIYNVGFTRAFGAAMTFRNGAIKSCAECFLYTPLLYFPSYYASKAVFYGSTPKEGMQEYQRDFPSVMMKYVALWMPTNCITFGPWCPPQFRVAFTAMVSFGWTALLSYLSPMTAKATASDDLAVVGENAPLVASTLAAAS